MKVRSDIRAALRLLLIVLWAAVAVVTPAHACCPESVDLRSATTAVADADDHGSPELTKSVAHCCTVCHGHFSVTASGKAFAPVLKPETTVLVAEAGSPASAVYGPYRPPCI